jgi:hypothetical protein
MIIEAALLVAIVVIVGTVMRKFTSGGRTFSTGLTSGRMTITSDRKERRRGRPRFASLAGSAVHAAAPHMRFV